MTLSDNEKRDVIKYLEAGKPLPEKYRFLLFDDAREVELLWNGKTNEVTNSVLPFQVIEQIDEPRSDEKIGLQSTLFDDSGRQLTGWTNKLIWGDNKLILSSLANGPMRKEIEAQGLVFSGRSPDSVLMEIAELPKTKHPFFLGTQFHPEFLARPLDPHPLFTEFLKAVLSLKK
jgi:CTP synthase (UTP-ammonia lyase)